MKTKYQIKLFSQETVEKEIEKLVKIAKEEGSNLSVERNMLTNSDLKFVKISIDKDMLRYYTENNRTVADCRHFVEKENPELPSSYFDIDNSDNAEVQKNYHEIIYKQADVDTIVDAYRTQKEQRDPIYITAKGVVANGNTRLSVIREKMDEWSYVDCYVYEERYSNDWTTIEAHTSQRDNIKDFRQPDPWYSKSDTYNKYKKRGLNDDLIARLMNYWKNNKIDVIGMKDDVNKCILAQEFLDHDLSDEYAIFEDLKKMGTDSGGQVFSTLHSRLNNWQNKIKDPRLFLKLKQSAFHMLSYPKMQIKGISAHTAVSRIFSADNIKALTIKSAEEKASSGKEIEVEPSGLTLEERHTYHQNLIKDAVAAYEVAKSKKETKFSEDKLSSAFREIEQAYNGLNEKSHVAAINQLSNNIKEKLDELENRIKDLKLD